MSARRPPLRADPPAAWIDEVARRRRARLAAGVASHAPPAARPPVGDERVAVVVATRNRCREVVRTLSRLAALPERPDVVVVDDGSTDGTASAVRRRHPWVEVIVLEHRCGAAARNVAVERLTTRYVAFADDDSWWEPGSLSRAADIMDAHDDIGALTATILTHPDGDEDPIVQDLRASPLPDQPELPGHPLLSILAGASLLRVKAFRQVGGFEPRFEIGGEEELLAADLAAAGWALRYLPDLTVHHAASTARDPHRRRANGLRNDLWFNWLRRPLADAAWRSLRTLRAAPWDRVTARAVVEAAAGLPWVARERRILPPPVAEGLRLLDGQQLASEARQYRS